MNQDTANAIAASVAALTSALRAERDALRAECERLRAFVASLRADGLDIDDPSDDTAEDRRVDEGAHRTGSTT